MRIAVGTARALADAAKVVEDREVRSAAKALRRRAVEALGGRARHAHAGAAVEAARAG